DRTFHISLGTIGSSKIKLGAAASAKSIATGGTLAVSPPTISPAYMGVGFIIGPELAALNFAGGVLAWGVLVPLLVYVLGPELQGLLPAGGGEAAWNTVNGQMWRFIVRPIAVGGMLVGTVYTLYRRRESIFGGLGKALKELSGDEKKTGEVPRTEQYMSSKTVFLFIGITFVLMVALYISMTKLVVGGTV